MLFVFATAVCFIVPPFGLIGIATMLFVVVRSWMWAHRLRMEQLSGKSLPAPINSFVFLFGSIGIGITATLASAVAFVCTCVPIGFIGVAAFNFPMYRTSPTLFGIDLPTILFIGLCTVCASFALWMGCILIRATLPVIVQENGIEKSQVE
jgi:hypothetical protein